MNNRQRVLLAGILLAAMMACAVPGASVPDTADMSVSSEDQLATIVAGTASVLQTQTAVAVPPTETPVSLPTSTMTPTATSTPVVSVNAKSSLQKKADDSVEFIDQVLYVKFVLPAGWEALRVNESEYYSFWSSDFITMQPVVDVLELMQSTSVQQVRVFGMDLQPGHIVSDFVTRMDLIYYDNEELTLEEVTEQETAEQFLQEELLSTEYIDLPGGMPASVIIRIYDGLNSRNEIVKVYYQIVIFEVDGGFGVLSLHTPDEFKETTVPDFQKILDSIETIQ
jgi:hypothetical protein